MVCWGLRKVNGCRIHHPSSNAAHLHFLKDGMVQSMFPLPFSTVCTGVKIRYNQVRSIDQQWTKLRSTQSMSEVLKCEQVNVEYAAYFYIQSIKGVEVLSDTDNGCQLTNDSLASQSLCGYSEKESNHGRSTIQHFRKCSKALRNPLVFCHHDDSGSVSDWCDSERTTRRK